MKVVFLKSRAAFRGGLEKYTYKLLEAFAAHKCETLLLTTGAAPKIEGATVISLAPDSRLSSLYQLLRFDALCKKWVGQNGADIVFGMERTTSQTHYRAGSGLHAAYLQRRKMVDPLSKRLFNRINPLHIALLALEKKAFLAPGLKTIFANSQMVEQEIVKTYNPTHCKIEVVHNGVEWQRWQEPFQKSLNRKQESFHLLFVGNGYQRKGLLFLLEGLALIKNEDFVLTVVGKDKNCAFYTKWVESAGLKKKVRFLGPQSDMLPLYQASDALVIPSIYDPFANVTVEALAMGLFVITSPFNGGKEVLKPYSGVTIEELGSAASMASALRKAFEYPKIERSAWQIRQSIKGLDFSFQLDKIVRKTLEN